MAPNSRIGTAKFVTIPEPLATRIYQSDQSRLLGREAKHKLFENTIPFSGQYKKEAKELLERVSRLSNGALQSTFQLKSDDVDNIPFQLLNPGRSEGEKHDISTQEEEMATSYIAASYCWRQLQQSHLDNTVDNIQALISPLPMSCLLYTALLNERQSQSEGIWIDQACINQDDEVEKQMAVNNMDIIYKCARTVVILLDDIEITMTEQEALEAYILDFEAEGRQNEGWAPRKEEPPYLHANKIMRNIYLKILQARWFSRAWCMHEARLGKQHCFLIRCEQQPALAPTVFRFTSLFMLNLVELGTRAWRGPLQWNRMWLIPVLTKALEDSKGIKRSSSSFMQVFAESFTQGAGGNPRIESPKLRQFDANLDRLSIAINTTGIGLAVSRQARDLNNGLPHPSEDECCRRFTIVALAAWDPSALCTSGRELRANSVKRSWMRWPLLVDANDYKQHRLGSWSMAFNPNLLSEWVGLNMGVFNRAGGLRYASKSRIAFCSAALHSSSSLGTDTLLTYGGKQMILSNDALNDLIIKTLACVMDCGIEWLTSSGKTSPIPVDLNTPLTRAGLQKLLDREAEMIRDEHQSLSFTWTADEKEEAQAMINLACYLIHKGPAVETILGQSMDFWQPVCIPNETGSKALTYVRQVPERGIFCATPFTLFPDSPNFYANLFRAWTLVKGEPERERLPNQHWVWNYHLMGKSRIFGAVMSEDDEHAFATIVNDVRVYGPIDLPL